MPGVKTNEVPGTRAVLRHYRMSAYKAREVLDLVRGKDADRAEEILAATPREAARVVEKVLASAVANARNNEQLDPYARGVMEHAAQGVELDLVWIDGMLTTERSNQESFAHDAK